MITYQPMLFDDMASDMDFMLDDRLHKIKSVEEEYRISEYGYVSFSGGLDSLIVSVLIDMALPNNQIPRVFCNTGVEYLETVRFIKRLAQTDSRIKIIVPKRSVKQIFTDFGYPFKSKYHSRILHTYQNSGNTTCVEKYVNRGDHSQWACPDFLKYNFTADFPLKVSDRCCYILKKQPFHKYEKESGRHIAITGIRRAEKGNRNNVACTVFENGGIKKFHPLAPCDDDFIGWFVLTHKLEINPLYRPPFNFKRTGCVGCPYNMELGKQLSLLARVQPSEVKRCFNLFGEVYKEYRRIHYRQMDSGELDEYAKD